MTEENQMGMDREGRDALVFPRLVLAVVSVVVSVLAAADGRRGRGDGVWEREQREWDVMGLNCREKNGPSPFKNSIAFGPWCRWAE